MFQALKYKYEVAKTYHRVRTLWEEFIKVSKNNDISTYAPVLNTFLDSFQSTYTLYMKHVDTGTKEGIDKIYGDCSEILTSLINWVDTIDIKDLPSNSETDTLLLELVSKSLHVAEIILRDDKYRQHVAQTPDIIRHIVSLLDKLTSHESTTILLQVINNISSSATNKLEIGRLDGFRKILRLLVHGDEQLTKQILKTIRIFLDVQDIEQNDTTDTSIQPRMIRSSSMRTLKDKITGVMVEVSKLAYSEFHRVFPTATTTSNPSTTPSSSATTSYDISQRHVFPPLREHISEILQQVEVLIQQPVQTQPSSTASTTSSSTDVSFPTARSDDVSNTTSESTTTSNATPPPSSSASPLSSSTTTSSLPSTDTSADLLKELMRMQGALSALTDTLSQAALTVQLDLIETISKLLFKNKPNQAEFFRLDGYNFILQFLDESCEIQAAAAEPTTSQSNTFTAPVAPASTHSEQTTPVDTVKDVDSFLTNVFRIIRTVLLDGNTDGVIGNLDAFRWLISILMHSHQTTVRYHALNCLIDICRRNVLNVMYLKGVKGIDILLTAFETAGTVPAIAPPPAATTTETTSKTPTKDRDPSHREKTPTPKSIRDLRVDVHSTPRLDAEPVMEANETASTITEWHIAQRIDQLLQYVTVVLSRYECLIPIRYITLLDVQLHSATPNPHFIALLYHSLIELTIHFNYIGLELMDGSIEKYVSWLKWLCEHDIKIPNTSATNHIPHFDLSWSATPSPPPSPSHSSPLLFRTLSLLAHSLFHHDTSKRLHRFVLYGGMQTLCTIVVKGTHADVIDLALYVLVQCIAAREYIRAELVYLITRQLYEQDEEKEIDVKSDVEGKDSKSNDSSTVSTPRKRTSTKSSPSATPRRPSITLTASLPSEGILPTTIESSDNSVCEHDSLCLYLLRLLDEPTVTISTRVKIFRAAFLLLRIPDHLPLPASFAPTITTFSCKPAFRECGALLSIVEWLKMDIKESDDVSRSNSRSRSTSRNSTNEAEEHTTRDTMWQMTPELSNIAFLILAESIHACDVNKQYVSDVIGFCTLAEVIRRSSIPLTQHVFDVFFELTTITSVPSLSNHTLPSTSKPPSALISCISDTILKQVFGASVYHTPAIQAVVERLIEPRRMFEEAWSVIEHSTPTTSPALRPLHNRRSLSESSLSSLLDSAHHKATHRSPLLHSAFHAFVSKCEQLHYLHESAPLPEPRPSTTSPPIRQSSRSRLRGIDTDSVGIGNDSPSSNNGFLKSNSFASYYPSGTVASTTIKFRNTDAALSIVLLLPYAGGAQPQAIKRLATLLESNPANKRALCQMHVVSILLRLCPRFHEEVRNFYLQLVATLGLYDVTGKQIRLLFELAALNDIDHCATPSDADQTRDMQHCELQMQMLYVIGRLTERISPLSYFNFDGVVSSLTLVPFTRFPSPRYGYTFCCWMQVQLFYGDQSSLLTWQDAHGTSMMELFFQSAPTKFDAAARCLCVRSAQGTVAFTPYTFSENGEWHHVAFVHSRAHVMLYIDGKLINKFTTVDYPSNVSKHDPLTGHIGASPPDSLRTTSFCGTLSTVSILEGALESSQIQALYEEGTYFEADFRTLGITNKRFLVVHPQEYTHANGTASPSHLYINSSSTMASPSTVRRMDVQTLLFSPIYLDGSLLSPPSKATRARRSRRSDVDRARERIEREGSSTSPPSKYAAKYRLTDRYTHSSSEPSSPRMMSPQVHAEVDVHHTHSIKTEIRHVGGIFMCVPFLTMGNAQQVAALRILGGLIERYRANLEEFEKSHGFYVVSHLLRCSESELTCETFHVLIDMICGCVTASSTTSPRIIRYPNGLLCVLDLIRHHTCDLPTRRAVIDSLVTLVTCVETPTNLDVWRAGPGIVSIVELLRLLPDASLFDSLQVLLEYLLPVIRQEEFDILMEYMISESEETTQLTEQIGLCRLLVHAFRYHIPLCTMLMKCGGVDILFLLLRSASEQVRADVLCMLALFLSQHPKYISTFVKSYGFETLHSLLAVHVPVPLSTCTVLIEFAFGAIKCEEEKKETIKPTTSASADTPSTSTADSSAAPTNASSKPPSNTDHGANDVPPVAESKFDRDLQYPILTRILLCLLTNCPNESSPVHLYVLDQIDLLCEKAENMDKLLDMEGIGWLEACQAYIQSLTAAITQASTDSPADGNLPSLQRILSKVYHILTRILVHDITRHYRTCKIYKIREMIEWPTFEIQVIEHLVAYYERHPLMDKNNAYHITRNLCVLWENIECIDTVPPMLLVRVINLLNVFATQNDSSVRTRMKDAGLFTIRDSCVLHCLRGDMSVDDRYAAFQQFSFDIVSSHPCFRDGNGILYLLKLLHDINDTRLQLCIGDILRNQLGSSDEHRRALFKIIQDTSMIKRFFPHMDMDDMLLTSSCFPLFTEQPTEEQVDEATTKENESEVNTPSTPPSTTSSISATSLSDLLNWYFSPSESPRRSAIQSRIDKQYIPLDTSYRKSMEKIQSLRSKKMKSRLERVNKLQITSSKGATEWIERLKTRIYTKGCKSFALKQQKYVDARLERMKMGENSWSQIRKELLKSGGGNEKERKSSGENEVRRASVSDTRSAHSGEEADLIPRAVSVSIAFPTSNATELSVNIVSIHDSLSALTASTLLLPHITNRCATCAQSFRTKWEMVCHVRLDHEL